MQSREPASTYFGDDDEDGHVERQRQSQVFLGHADDAGVGPDLNAPTNRNQTFEFFLWHFIFAFQCRWIFKRSQESAFEPPQRNFAQLAPLTELGFMVSFYSSGFRTGKHRPNYSRIRLYHMIKPVGPNLLSKCQLYCAKQSNPMMSSCSAALRRLVPSFKRSKLFLSTSNLSVSSEPSCAKETQSLMFVVVAARESVSQAATPAIRAICAALSA